MERTKPKHSSGQCHIQILNDGEVPFDDTIDNIDDPNFARILEATRYAVQMMTTTNHNVRVTLTIPPSCCLITDNWVKLVEAVERHPDIKRGSVKSDYDKKDTIKATSKNGLKELVINICGANAFYQKPGNKDDSFEVVEDLTQQMKQCEAFAVTKTPKSTRSFRGRVNQRY